ncbi:hypothetical protein C8R44DRAFT_858477 [Mycena epipterygia]|nr:hypothetical protein C8R44DRAFT_858477 [Mycena epipterygia]
MPRRAGTVRKLYSNDVDASSSRGFGRHTGAHRTETISRRKAGFLYAARAPGRDIPGTVRARTGLGNGRVSAWVHANHVTERGVPRDAERNMRESGMKSSPQDRHSGVFAKLWAAQSVSALRRAPDYDEINAMGENGRQDDGGGADGESCRIGFRGRVGTDQRKTRVQRRNLGRDYAVYASSWHPIRSSCNRFWQSQRQVPEDRNEAE